MKRVLSVVLAMAMVFSTAVFSVPAQKEAPEAAQVGEKATSEEFFEAETPVELEEIEKPAQESGGITLQTADISGMSDEQIAQLYGECIYFEDFENYNAGGANINSTGLAPNPKIGAELVEKFEGEPTTIGQEQLSDGSTNKYAVLWSSATSKANVPRLRIVFKQPITKQGRYTIACRYKVDNGSGYISSINSTFLFNGLGENNHCYTVLKNKNEGIADRTWYSGASWADRSLTINGEWKYSEVVPDRIDKIMVYYVTVPKEGDAVGGLKVAFDDIGLYYKPLGEAVDSKLNVVFNTQDLGVAAPEAASVAPYAFCDPTTMVLTNPDRAKTFKGWSFEPDGEVITAPFCVYANTTLYAIWEVDENYPVDMNSKYGVKIFYDDFESGWLTGESTSLDISSGRNIINSETGYNYKYGTKDKTSIVITKDGDNTYLTHTVPQDNTGSYPYFYVYFGDDTTQKIPKESGHYTYIGKQYIVSDDNYYTPKATIHLRAYWVGWDKVKNATNNKKGDDVVQIFTSKSGANQWVDRAETYDLSGNKVSQAVLDGTDADDYKNYYSEAMSLNKHNKLDHIREIYYNPNYTSGSSKSRRVLWDDIGLYYIPAVSGSTIIPTISDETPNNAVFYPHTPIIKIKYENGIYAEQLRAMKADPFTYFGNQDIDGVEWDEAEKTLTLVVHFSKLNVWGSGKSLSIEIPRFVTADGTNSYEPVTYTFTKPTLSNDKYTGETLGKVTNYGNNLIFNGDMEKYPLHSPFYSFNSDGANIFDKNIIPTTESEKAANGERYIQAIRIDQPGNSNGNDDGDGYSTKGDGKNLYLQSPIIYENGRRYFVSVSAKLMGHANQAEANKYTKDVRIFENFNFMFDEGGGWNHFQPYDDADSKKVSVNNREWQHNLKTEYTVPNTANVNLTTATFFSGVHGFSMYSNPLYADGKYNAQSYAIDNAVVKAMYTVRYDANGGTLQSGKTESELWYARDEDFTLPECPYEKTTGAKFKGWLCIPNMEIKQPCETIKPNTWGDDSFIIKAVWSDGFAPINNMTSEIGGTPADNNQSSAQIGIRFTGRVSAELKLMSSEYGYMIGRKSVLDYFIGKDNYETKFIMENTDIVKDKHYVTGSTYIKDKGIDMRYDFNDSTLETHFAAILYNIPMKNTKDDLVARPFAVVDGKYYYGECIVASAYDVANSVRNSTSYNELSDVMKTNVDNVIGYWASEAPQ